MEPVIHSKYEEHCIISIRKTVSSLKFYDTAVVPYGYELSIGYLLYYDIILLQRAYLNSPFLDGFSNPFLTLTNVHTCLLMNNLPFKTE